MDMLARLRANKEAVGAIGRNMMLIAKRPM
jgi:hypothetical protein